MRRSFKFLIGMVVVVFVLSFAVRNVKAYIELPKPVQAQARYWAFVLQAMDPETDGQVDIDGGDEVLGGDPMVPVNWGAFRSLALNGTLREMNTKFLNDGIERNEWDWQWARMVAYANKQLYQTYGTEEAGIMKDWMEEFGTVPIEEVPEEELEMTPFEWIMHKTKEAFKEKITTEVNGDSIVSLVAEFFGIDSSEIDLDLIAKQAAITGKEGLAGLDNLIEKHPKEFLVYSWAADLMKTRWAYEPSGMENYHIQIVQQFVKAADKVKPLVEGLIAKAKGVDSYELNFDEVKDRIGKYYDPFTGKEEEITVKSIMDLDLLSSFLQGSHFYARFIPESKVHREWGLPYKEEDFVYDTEAYNKVLLNLQVFIKTAELSMDKEIASQILKREVTNGIAEIIKGEEIDIYDEEDFSESLTPFVEDVMDIALPQIEELGVSEITPEAVEIIEAAIEEVYGQEIASLPIGETSTTLGVGEVGDNTGTASTGFGINENISNNPFFNFGRSDFGFGGNLW